MPLHFNQRFNCSTVYFAGSPSNLQPGTPSVCVRIVALTLEETGESFKSSATVRFVCLSLAGGLDFYDVTRALRSMLNSPCVTCLEICVSRRGQTTPQMFHEGSICFFHIFLNQVWQMSFDCCPVHFQLEVVTKCQIMTS